jgi:sugar phosphate permease
MQYAAVGLLVLSGCINYIDRSTLSIGNPMIREELGLSLGQMGLLLSAFSWSYAVAQLPVGALVDRVGPRVLLGAGLALWSLAQCAAGLVASFGQFIWARIALGVGESPQFTSSARVCANWFHVRNRALPFGIINSSSALGPAIAPPLLTALMLSFGWRPMFIIMGIAGLVAAAIWFVVYRDPEHADISAEERAWIRSADTPRAETGGFRVWARLFRFRTTWGLIFGFFGVVYMTWLYVTWLPGYLEIERHVSIKNAGIWSAVPQFCGFIGAVLGGFIADTLAARGIAPIASRKIPLVCGLFGVAICTVAGALAGSVGAAIFFMSCAVFCGNVASTNGWTLSTTMAPGDYVASVGAIQNFGGYVGGSPAPVVTGYVVQGTGSFVPALLIAAAIACMSALVYWFVARDPISGQELAA